MTLPERLTAKYQEITASGATVGKLICGVGVVEQEGVHATAYDLGFTSVEVEFVEGSVFGLQKIVTSIEGI